MNSIEQLIASANQNANAEAQAQPQQQAVGQDYQQTQAQPQQPVQQEVQQQPPQAMNTHQEQPVQQAQPEQQPVTQQQPPQAVNTQTAQPEQSYTPPQHQPQAQPQQQYAPQAQPQQQYAPQAQQPQAQPQAPQPQMMPQAVDPMGNMNADVPANLPAEIAKYVGAREMTMDNMSSSDLAVQDWLKPSYHGMTLGSAPQSILQPFTAEIDMNQGSGFMLCQMVRWTVKTPSGEQTEYVHTYDGITGSDGKPWHQAVTTAFHASNDPTKPNVPYPSVQIPIRLTQDIICPQTGNVLAQAGLMVGHTTAKTGWKNWQDFYNTVKANGLLGQNVPVKISNQAVAPKNTSYTWGVIEFKLNTQPAQ